MSKRHRADPVSVGTYLVRAPNRVVDLHFSNVLWQMRDLGPPTIRVYDSGDGSPLLALEGSHRLASAVELGLPVELEFKSLRDRMAHDFYDLPSPCSVKQIVAYLCRPDFDEFLSPIYTVETVAKRSVSHLHRRFKS